MKVTIVKSFVKVFNKKHRRNNTPPVLAFISNIFIKKYPYEPFPFSADRKVKNKYEIKRWL